jgi:lipopolysaccharide biosynthesis glycosyltransferase
LKTFCTILTADHIAFAKVLFHSLQKQDPEINLQVLVVDKDDLQPSEGIVFHSVKTVTNSGLGQGMVIKYAHTDPDHFRWALKPIFISFLLQNGFEKVIFIDPDIYFVNKFDFLFAKLDQSNILLTPHWCNTDPMVNESGLYDVLQGGLFNAGFIGANNKAIEALTWWAKACHFKTEKNPQLGLFVDQKYLDILSVQFENVEIIRHRGCNLASWNINTSKREMIDGKLVINSRFEPVFIHFAKATITNIVNYNDKLLMPYLEEYSNLLKKENFDLMEKFNDLDFSRMNYKIMEWKHWLRLRTRFKRFLFKLAERI